MPDPAVDTSKEPTTQVTFRLEPKDGGCRRSPWQLEPRQLTAVREAVAQIERSWGSALQRLRAFAEEEDEQQQ